MRQSSEKFGGNQLTRFHCLVLANSWTTNRSEIISSEQRNRWRSEMWPRTSISSSSISLASMSTWSDIWEVTMQIERSNDSTHNIFLIFVREKKGHFFFSPKTIGQGLTDNSFGIKQSLPMHGEYKDSFTAGTEQLSPARQVQWLNAAKMITQAAISKLWHDAIKS